MTSPNDDRKDDLPEAEGIPDDIFDLFSDEESPAENDAGAESNVAEPHAAEDDFELDLFGDGESNPQQADATPLEDPVAFDLEETTEVVAETPAVEMEDMELTEHPAAGTEPSETDDIGQLDFGLDEPQTAGAGEPQEAGLGEPGLGEPELGQDGLGQADDFEFEFELDEEPAVEAVAESEEELEMDDGSELEETQDHFGAPTAESVPGAEPSELQGGAEDFELKLEPPEEAPPAAAAAVAMDALPPGGETMQVAPAIKVRRSPLVPMIKIGIGAVLGILIFQIGSWWAGFDFFGLAPALPDAVAWLAPAHLRPDLTKPIRPATPPPFPEPEMLPADDDEDTSDRVDDESTNGTNDIAAETTEDPLEAMLGDDDTVPAEEAVPASDLAADTTANPETPLDPPSSPLPGDDMASDLSLDREESPAADTDLAEAIESDGMPGDDNASPPLALDEPGDLGTGELGTGDRLPSEDPLEDGLATSEPAMNEPAMNEPATPFALSNESPNPRAAEPMESAMNDEQTLNLDEQALDLVQPDPEPPAAPVGPLPPAWFPLEEVTAAVTTAKAADERLDEAQLSKQDLRQAARDFYVSLANLAERFTYAEPRAGEAALFGTRELVARFEFDDKKLKLIGNAARQWYERNLGQGILLAGAVGSVEVGDATNVVTLTLFGKATQPIVVVMRKGEPPQAGQRLVVLGTTIDNPAVNLPGYSGTQPRVVWAGLVHPIP